MMLRDFLTVACMMLLSASAMNAQWRMQRSNTTADLRGIDAQGQVAWATGTKGTVLRTTDGGTHWQTCPTPLGAEDLDFRGVQVLAARTAVIMSSGKGSASRVYKTTDACHSWKLVLSNPDADGFWDAIKFVLGEKDRPYRTGVLYGDPVHGDFVEFDTYDYGETWRRSQEVPGARPGEALFAASNSSLLYLPNGSLIVTGGPSGSRSREEQYNFRHDPHVRYRFVGGDIPLAVSDTGGAFSVATSATGGADPILNGDWIGGLYGQPATLVVVGGDFRRPDVSQGTAAFSLDGGQHWTVSTNPPGGYRSAVAFDPSTKTWIAVGPNGTDISRDDGRNWRALRPNPAIHEPADADHNWNAIALPFVVGPKGRIGKLRAGVLQSYLRTPASGAHIKD